MAVRTTVVFFIFFAIFCDVALTIHNNTLQCPAAVSIEPCTCNLERMNNLEFSCRNAQVDQVQKILANNSLTNHVSHLELRDIELFNLRESLFVGLKLRFLRVQQCIVSSVDDTAFATMADELKSLILNYNVLEHVPSEALRNLSSLRFLWLDNNRIHVLHADAFMGLNSLDHLSLSNNRIKYIDESAFLGLGKLTSLYLDSNELTAVPTQALRHVGSTIRSLYLNGNKIAALKSEEFVSMGGQSLSYLTLGNNIIRYLPSKPFLSLRNLECVVLNGNGIETVHPLAFQGLEDLRRLGLSHNSLDEVPAEALVNMSRIWSISLNSNSISTIRENDLQPFAGRLEAISLGRNSLKTIDPLAFVGMDVLRRLDLSGNLLKSAAYETYAPVLDTLQDFDIYDNPFHCDCDITWLSDWMKGNGSSMGYWSKRVKCATPEEFRDMPIKDLETERLNCPNSSDKNDPNPEENSV